MSQNDKNVARIKIITIFDYSFLFIIFKLTIKAI